MSTETKMQALNARMQSAFNPLMDELDRINLRQIRHQSIKCINQCYEKAGSKWDSQQLQNCAERCQVPVQASSQIVQGEIQQFQNRLQRSMMECQDKAKDSIQPGMESDPSQQTKAEGVALACMTQVVDTQIGLIKPLKQRIESQLQQLSSQVDGQMGSSAGEQNKQKRGWW